MKRILLPLLLLLAFPAWAQSPQIVINQTPVVAGTAAQCLYITSSNRVGQQACGTGTAANIQVGTTTVSNGTTTRVLYDNAGVLGEYTLSGSGAAVAMAASPTFSGVVTFPDTTTWQSAGLYNDRFIFRSATVTTSGVGSIQPLMDYFDRSQINSVPNVSGGFAQRYFALGDNYIDQLATVNNNGLCDNRLGQLKGDIDMIVYTDSSVRLGGVALSGCHNTPHAAFLPLTDNEVALGDPAQKWSNVYTQEVQVAGGVVALTQTNGVGTTSKVSAFTTTAVPAGGNVNTCYFITSASIGLCPGSGPATLSMAQGSIYIRSDGAPAFNTNGTTGWDEIVGLASMQTLTNKSLTSPTITGTGTIAASTGTFSGALKTTSTLSVGSTNTAEAIDLTGNMFLRTGGATIYGGGAVTFQAGSGQGLSLLTNAGGAGATISSGGALSGVTDITGTGTIRANTGFSANGSAGLSTTKTVRDAAGTGTCTLIFTSGLLTGGSC